MLGAEAPGAETTSSSSARSAARSAISTLTRSATSPLSLRHRRARDEYHLGTRRARGSSRTFREERPIRRAAATEFVGSPCEHAFVRTRATILHADLDAFYA